MDERVLVIPTTHFESVGAFTGFKRADDRYRARLLEPTACSFRPRSEMETDPSFKQLIPYVVLQCEGVLFHYRRGKAGTERRLEAKRSIGVGGHISESDQTGSGSPYRKGMLRELTEEVTIDCPYAEVHFGFIYDPSTPVGAVHLGVVHLFELASTAVAPREDALADAGFAPLTELAAARGEFETWSQFVLDELSAAT
ncbi:MAG: phosphoesterase [Gemmataceae bacterium]